MRKDKTGFAVLKSLPAGMLMLLFFAWPAMAQQVSLNEIMASNSAVVADEDGDYEDWIEIYNYGDEEVNLKGFYLSDDYAEPYMWEFPEAIIHPGEHLLVWASGKDRRDPGAPLHTNFRIARQGEEVYFTNLAGKRIDEIAPTPIPRDMVYGRYPDGTGSWHYLEHPTPGGPNTWHLHDQPLLMYYWFFDTGISNNTPLASLEAFYGIMTDGQIKYMSCMPGYPYSIGHDYWRKASMERRNMPTPINYRPEGNDSVSYLHTDIRGLQVRAPFEKDDAENTIILHMPSSGFENLTLRFAARDEGAADYLIIDYAVEDSQDSWSSAHLASSTLSLEPYYQLYDINFHHVSLANDNPHFKVRIRFGGDDMHDDDGSRVTFNNISLDGMPLKAYYIQASSGGYGNIRPYGFNRAYCGQDITFDMFPAPNHFLDQLIVNGTDVTESVVTGDEIINHTLADITEDHHVKALFSVSDHYLAQQKDQLLVYPNPATDRIKISASEKLIKVQVLNLQGAIVYENVTEACNYYLATQGLPGGIYVLRLHFEEAVVARVIQVQRF